MRPALTSLPSGVNGIGSYAFNRCTNLALTELPSGLTSIGDNAFSHCTGLTNITLPSSLTTVGYRIFDNCNPTLQNIYIKTLESAPAGWDANWYSNISASKIHWAQPE